MYTFIPNEEWLTPCVNCGTVFQAKRGGLFCCEHCAPEPIYIYSWTLDQEDKPMYIGQSSKPNRCVCLHTIDYDGIKTLSQAEFYRQRFRQITVSILFTGLDQRSADYIENSLIELYTQNGAVLLNVLRPDPLRFIPLAQHEYDTPSHIYENMDDVNSPYIH